MHENEVDKLLWNHEELAVKVDEECSDIITFSFDEFLPNLRLVKELRNDFFIKALFDLHLKSFDFVEMSVLFHNFLQSFIIFEVFQILLKHDQLIFNGWVNIEKHVPILVIRE